MGIFNRSAGVRVTDKPVANVTSARLEWGYDNFYRYHWAGRTDSAAAAGNDSLWMAGQVGTSYGGERDTDDWVCVTRVDIPLAANEFTDTTATFTVPSWAPGSSPEVARWACRLVVERGGGDVDERGEFHVVIGAGDVDAFGLQFALPLPADATPTTTAVHSSVSWFIGARIFYAGFTGHQVERVRRQIVFVNA